ncbi:methionyl-tRNA formyltransferase [Candidatus Bodocaedibacter vickermanii]|uniref:Methionyl-tRNA formyltransferase n=1 Tax=Candidatus Bodocaedibacter vickermanii TaxID=2741701 RepID=A0A7L9RS59_9PROT|nr:Methionyl-tRNA formyltransferase [Candidatus Paracaedibacteraceae bacterium 'Lake Konstanz']
MRIVFMGTPTFAAAALQSILEAKLNVVAVYTQPPKPVGRGYEVTKSATHDLAERHNIPVYYPKTLRTSEAQDELKALKPDICVVAAYGFILPQAVLDIPPLGCINIHGSLLPRWRGAAPIQHAILAGDTETGITIMNMDVGMDTGDMLYKRSVPITSTTTSQMLFDELARLGADMIVDYLHHPDQYPATPQPVDDVTMAPKIDKSMARLDWRKTAVELERQLRAFTPWPGAFTIYNNTVLKIGGLNTISDRHSQTPGTILNDQLHIACGNGTVLAITSLQRPGGKMLPTTEFLKGFEIKTKDRLDTCNVPPA